MKQSRTTTLLIGAAAIDAVVAGATAATGGPSKYECRSGAGCVRVHPARTTALDKPASQQRVII